jgi:hypothetical protein
MRLTPIWPQRDDASGDTMRRRVRREADQLDKREEEAT